ncbi:MAG: DUF3341 domain-containing protein [Acidobacteriota bacterium]
MPPVDSFLAPSGSPRRRIHTLAFEHPGATLEAVHRLRAEGFEVHDVFSPFPLHGMDEALGLAGTRLGFATLVGGLFGAAIAFGFQVWTHAIDWPLIIGGKSPLALPAQVPVSFELTILCAAFATVGGLLVRRRLFPRLTGERPLSQPDPRVTDDRFVVLVVERNASFSPARFHELGRALGSVEIVEGWRTL